MIRYGVVEAGIRSGNVAFLPYRFVVCRTRGAGARSVLDLTKVWELRMIFPN